MLVLFSKLLYLLNCYISLGICIVELATIVQIEVHALGNNNNIRTDCFFIRIVKEGIFTCI